MRKSRLTPAEIIEMSYLESKRQLGLLDPIEEINLESKQMLLMKRLDKKIKRLALKGTILTCLAIFCFISAAFFIIFLFIRLLC